MSKCFLLSFSHLIIFKSIVAIYCFQVVFKPGGIFHSPDMQVGGGIDVISNDFFKKSQKLALNNHLFNY